MCCDQDHEKIAQDAIQKYKDMQRAILRLLEDFKNGNLQNKE